jgi:hypothetical protein
VVFTSVGEVGGPSSADSIVKISGDEQNVQQDTTTTGTGGTTPITFNPMVVQVTDRFGNPIPGVDVFFRVSVGFGSLSSSTDATDGGGFAETVYTSQAGSTGDVAVSASVPGVGTVIFTGSIEAIGEPSDTTGGGGGGGDNPVPTVASIAPTDTTAGGPGFLLNVTGTNFIAESVVRWGSTDKPTQFVNSTTLNAQISSSDIATAGPVLVSVFNPEPGGGTSNTVTFTVNP